MASNCHVLHYQQQQTSILHKLHKPTLEYATHLSMAQSGHLPFKFRSEAANSAQKGSQESSSRTTARTRSWPSSPMKLRYQWISSASILNQNHLKPNDSRSFPALWKSQDFLIIYRRLPKFHILYTIHSNY